MTLGSHRRTLRAMVTRLPVVSSLLKLDSGPRTFLLFIAFNLVSWQCVVGPTLVLFGRKLGMPASCSGLNTITSHATLATMMDIEKYQGNASTTAALLDAGIELMRQNFRRRHPGQTETEIDAMLSAWLRRSDDPIPGDTAGSVCVRTREA